MAIRLLDGFFLGFEGSISGPFYVFGCLFHLDWPLFLFSLPLLNPPFFFPLILYCLPFFRWFVPHIESTGFVINSTDLVHFLGRFHSPRLSLEDVPKSFVFEAPFGPCSSKDILDFGSSFHRNPRVFFLFFLTPFGVTPPQQHGCLWLFFFGLFSVLRLSYVFPLGIFFPPLAKFAIQAP